MYKINMVYSAGNINLSMSLITLLFLSSVTRLLGIHCGFVSEGHSEQWTVRWEYSRVMYIQASSGIPDGEFPLLI